MRQSNYLLPRSTTKPFSKVDCSLCYITIRTVMSWHAFPISQSFWIRARLHGHMPNNSPSHNNPLLIPLFLRRCDDQGRKNWQDRNLWSLNLWSFRNVDMVIWVIDKIMNWVWLIQWFLFLYLYVSHSALFCLPVLLLNLFFLSEKTEAELFSVNSAHPPSPFLQAIYHFNPNIK